MTPTTTTLDPANSPAGRLLRDPGGTLTAWAHQGWDAAAPWLIALVVAAVALAVILFVIRISLRRQRVATFARGARMIVVAVPPEVDAAGAMTLWTNLVELLRPPWRRLLSGQPHLGFEMVWSQEGLRVSVWVPGPVAPRLVERAIESAWPAARTQVLPVRSPLPLDVAARGGELRLCEPEWFPLRTDHAVDPLRSLLGAAATEGPDEWAVVQVLARPVSGRRLVRGRRARDRRGGRSSTVLARLLDLVTPGPTAPTTTVPDPTMASDVRAIVDKTAGPCWEAVVRYGVAGSGGRQRLRGRAHAVASAFAAFGGRNRLARHRLRRPGESLATRRMQRGDLVSVAELAALAHLPIDATVPGLERAGARAAMPPPAVPEAGKVLGDADAGPRRPVALAVADARHHLHVMGSTGSGKSTLLTNLVLDDVEAGRGAVVIDPKGDLVTDILDRLPASVADRLVVLDPDSAGIAPALDVLGGDDHDLVVDHLVGIFRRIFESYWGPRTDDILRAAVLTLLQQRGANLADVPTLLTNPAMRARYVLGRDDAAGLGGFWAWYEGLSEAEQARVVGPVMNKLRAFLMRRFVRTVVGPGPAPLDMAGVLDGGLLLVRAPKGVLGDETAKLLGSLVVARVWQAVTARAKAGARVRVDATLYVDECQNFLNLPRSFEEMLAEARGYRLGMVLAHQHLTQLPRDLRDAVSANARSKVLFTVSPEDAASLARHVEPELGAHDLSHLGAYQAAARLVVDGRERPAFTLVTRPAPAAVPGRADALRRALAARRPAAEPEETSVRVRLDPALRRGR